MYAHRENIYIVFIVVLMEYIVMIVFVICVCTEYNGKASEK